MNLRNFIFLLGVMPFCMIGQSVHSVIETNSDVDTALYISGEARTGLIVDMNNIAANDGLLNNTRGILVTAGTLGIRAKATYLDAIGVYGESLSGTGVRGVARTFAGAGVFGRNEFGNGVWGSSDSPEYAGVFGQGENGNGIYGTTQALSILKAGVSGFAKNGIGVLGESENSIGIRAYSKRSYGLFVRSDESVALNARSETGKGLEVISIDNVGATFIGGHDEADIMFPRNTHTVNGGAILDLKGVIASDLNHDNSDLELWSNDDLTVIIDRDNSSNTGSFQVQNSNGQSLIHVHEVNGTDIRSNLEFKSAGGDDNGIIMSDRGEPSSDIIIDSNHDIVLRLDENGGESGQLRVEDSGNTVVFRLTEAGNLNIGGTLNQGSDINRKHSIQQVDNNEVIRKIEDLSIYTWKYNGETDTHLGPMAQDFYAAFGLGQGETTISSVDADGIALAGIKALASENKALNKKVETLTRLVEELMLKIEKN